MSDWKSLAIILPNSVRLEKSAIILPNSVRWWMVDGDSDDVVGSLLYKLHISSDDSKICRL